MANVKIRMRVCMRVFCVSCVSVVRDREQVIFSFRFRGSGVRFLPESRAGTETL